MAFWPILLGTLAWVSLGIVLWQWRLAARFPLRRPRAPLAPPPPISILKPLKGTEPHTAECLESWLAQEYPGSLQFLFGVRSPDDPVCALARDLIARHPEVDAQLLICPESFGPNGKVSTLLQLHPLAKHSLILVSDADVRVEPEFLCQAVAAFDSPRVGLVCSFYALANPQTIPMHLEALAVNVDFWGQVLQDKALGKHRTALGAVMIARAGALERIGGFKLLADFLADDYQLGRRISALGCEVRLTNTVVECWSGKMSARAVWQHQVRWARTIRVSRPFSYFFSILGLPLFWAALWAIHYPGTLSVAALQITALVRIVMAFDLQRRILPPGLRGSPVLLIWLKDALQLVLWAAAFLGTRVVWRGELFDVLPNGKLRKVAEDAAGQTHRLNRPG